MPAPSRASWPCAPTLVERYAALGADPVTSTPEEFTNFIRQEYVKWAKVVKLAKIEP